LSKRGIMAKYTVIAIVPNKWHWKKLTPERNRYAGGRYAVTESDV
jgi:hypothetical protein